MKRHIVTIIALSIMWFASLSVHAENSQLVGVKTNHPLPEQQTAQNKDTLIISGAWARKSTSPNSNSAAYMKIKNPTDKQITIIGASAAKVSDNVELHESFVDERGISRMTSIDRIIVPANSFIELAPGGIHIMLFNLKNAFKEKDKFEITVQIEGMKPIMVETIVESN